jgi:SAM-dependent methyltransferase
MPKPQPLYGSRVSEGTPPSWGIRRRVADGLAKLGLERPALRAYELALATKSGLGRRRSHDADGLPLPPARLRVQVGPQAADADFFLRSGREHAELLQAMLRDGGTSIDTFDAILDLGCGCGRILRHWARLPARVRVCGCDINAKAIDWCQAHLEFAEVSVNKIAPPLPYPDRSFDFVYALSVFTHLDEELQHAWIRDCRRVLKPNGYLLFSTMGEHYADLNRLTSAERQAFRAGQLVVLYGSSVGTNLCSAYHPHEYVNRHLAADLEPVLSRPATEFNRHDIYLFRNPML